MSRRAAQPSILIVGNYPPDRQRSMLLFARLLGTHLRRLGFRVTETAPPVIAGRLAGGRAGLVKLFGYIDKFLIFPLLLGLRARFHDCVHITDHSNALYVGAAGRARTLVTCHDLFAVQILLGEVPGRSWGLNGRILQRLILRGLRRARALTVVSEHTLSELRRITGTLAPVTLIPNALPESFGADDPLAVPAIAERGLVRLGFDPAVPFFLHVGGNTYYKNRPGVVRLFAELAQRPEFARHRLVLAGAAPDAPLQAALDASSLRARIDVVIDAPDADIRALYHCAAALLFISLEEGFGWPILEAQACGCPVVTSDRDPMRQVAGGAAVLVDPLDPPAAAERILGALPDFDSLRAKGHANAARYRPEAVFPRYGEVYRGFTRSAPDPG